MQNVSGMGQDGRERRRYRRTRVLFPGKLVSGDQSVEGVVLDISANGAKVRLAKPLGPSSAITLRLARSIDFHVVVSWDKGNTLGLKFREAPARIASILAALLRQECLAA